MKQYYIHTYGKELRKRFQQAEGVYPEVGTLFKIVVDTKNILKLEEVAPIIEMTLDSKHLVSDEARIFLFKSKQRISSKDRILNTVKARLREYDLDSNMIGYMFKGDLSLGKLVSTSGIKTIYKN